MKKLLVNEPWLFFVFFVVITAVVLVWLHLHLPESFSDYVPELFGFLLDLIVFGILFTSLERWREKQRDEKRTQLEKEREIEFLQRELRILSMLTDEEHVRRKVSLIERLNELKANLPQLSALMMPRAFMHNIDMRGAYVKTVDFSGAFLIETDLSGIITTGSVFSGADCQRAKFCSAVLKHASFREFTRDGIYTYGADLHKADFSYADLHGANFVGATFDETILTGANLLKTNFENVDLSGTIGLTWSQIKQAKIQGVILPIDVQRQKDEEELAKTN